MNTHSLSRRRILTLAAAGLAFPLGGLPLTAAPRPTAMRPIPSTGEAIPVLGMGMWITFNVGSSSRLRGERVKVLQAFFDHGGRMVDSSPMYGSAEDVVGYCLKRVRDPSPLFSATKIWTSSDAEGVVKMQASERLWGESQFDLQQVHNLLNWEFHLARLKEWKVSGRIRYLGITTSHGRRHSDFVDVMQAEPLDFVQLTYNILDREVEDRLLPLAADRGQAVIVNRPFQRGGPSKLRSSSAARMGARVRCAQLGAILSEVRGVAPGRHLCHSGDIPGRPYGREHGGGARPYA